MNSKIKKALCVAVAGASLGVACSVVQDSVFLLWFRTGVLFGVVETVIVEFCHRGEVVFVAVTVE